MGTRESRSEGGVLRDRKVETVATPAGVHGGSLELCRPKAEMATGDGRFVFTPTTRTSLPNRPFSTFSVNYH